MGSDCHPESRHEHGSMSPMKPKAEVRRPDWGGWTCADIGFQVGTELESGSWNIPDWVVLRESWKSFEKLIVHMAG